MFKGLSSWDRFWLISLLVKVFFAAFLPLSADECYYWVWSRHLQASYFDHPPMVAYWFAVAEWLGFGGYSVRFICVVLGHLGFWFWVKVFDADRASEAHRNFWLLLLAHPLTGLGSIIMTPDAPLMFFATLSAWWVKKGVGNLHRDNPVLGASETSALGQLPHSEKKAVRPVGGLGFFQVNGKGVQNVVGFYFILGFLLGLGFMSKYHIVIWALGLGLWLLSGGGSQFWRQLFGCGGLVWGLIGFFAGSFPVWWWNYQHDWISFRFQWSHGLGAGSSPWWETMGLYVAGQVLLMHPVTWWYLLRNDKAEHFFSLVQRLRLLRKATGFSWLAVQLLSFPFFLISSFRKHVEANWTTLAFPAWLYISSRVMPSRVARGVGLFWFGVIALVASHWVKPWAAFLPEKFSEVHEEKVFIEELKKMDCSVVFTTNYQKASLLYFYSQVPTYKLSGVGRKDQFDLWAFDQRWNQGFCTLFPSEHRAELQSRWGMLEPVVKAQIQGPSGRSWELILWEGSGGGHASE
jgi:4-amino-4-deoxy-L-arabinose transferase-like glycosyltransferase